MSDQTPKKMLSCNDSSNETPCPMCFKNYPVSQIEIHVNKCIFLSSRPSNENQGTSSQTNHQMKRVSDFKQSPTPKKAKENLSTKPTSERSITSDLQIKSRQVGFAITVFFLLENRK